jgi:hypothetical protein
VKSLEEQYREFRESKEPCSFKVPASARRRGIARNKGESTEAMMLRLGARYETE